jgi:hypothetical protein
MVAWRDPRSAMEVAADARYAALRDGLRRDAVVIGRTADVAGLIEDAKEKGRTMEVLDAAVVGGGSEAPKTEVVVADAPAVPAAPVPPTVVVPPLVDRILIAGLADRVREACNGLAAARLAASGLSAATRTFTANANEIAKQVTAANDDLVFQATKLGNSGGSSGGQ